jgi:hypothetical protein
MHKTLGNILVFFGSAGIIVNAVMFLARRPFSGAIFPVAIALLVIGAGLIKFGRKAGAGQES